MKKIIKNNKGQALAILAIVLFLIVVFLVIISSVLPDIYGKFMQVIDDIRKAIMGS